MLRIQKYRSFLFLKKDPPLLISFLFNPDIFIVLRVCRLQIFFCKTQKNFIPYFFRRNTVPFFLCCF